MRLRPALVLWHRWFGLLAALWLLILALTGSFLVFYAEVDRALNPDLRQVAVRGQTAPVADWVGALETAFPGKRVDYLMLPEWPGDSATAFIAPERRPGDPEPQDADFRQTYVDQYTAQVLGDRRFGEAGLDRRRLAQFIYQLHIDMMLGPTMVWVLGLIALLWVLDHIVSAVLAFPTARTWAKSFVVRWRAGGHRRTFDLHRAGGLWLFPVTLVLAVSGIAFNWPEEFDAAVDLVADTSPGALDGLAPLAVPDHTPRITVDRAIALAEAQPGAGEIRAVSWHPTFGVFYLRLHDPAGRTGADRAVVIDYDGRLRADLLTGSARSGDVIRAWMFPLHSGQAFGWPGRIAVFVSGLLLSGLIVTGLMIWAVRQRARQRLAARAGTADQTPRLFEAKNWR